MYALCGYALLWSDQSLQILSPIPLPPTPFFNSFQYASLYPLPSIPLILKHHLVVSFLLLQMQKLGHRKIKYFPKVIQL
jgi:hypothetical protein